MIVVCGPRQVVAQGGVIFFDGVRCLGFKIWTYPSITVSRPIRRQNVVTSSVQPIIVQCESIRIKSVVTVIIEISDRSSSDADGHFFPEWF